MELAGGDGGSDGCGGDLDLADCAGDAGGLPNSWAKKSAMLDPVLGDGPPPRTGRGS